MLSTVEKRGQIAFPENTGERIYMVPFVRELPARYARWQRTVDQMLEGIEVERAYLMVDQGWVEAGACQRREGLHVDGNWIEELRCHGQPEPTVPGHHGERVPYKPPHHAHGVSGMWDNPGDGRWKHKYQPETILLATDVTGCRAYVGDFEGSIGEGGACQGDTRGLRAVDLKAGYAWAGNVTMVHEVFPMQRSVARTVVRINVPGHC